MKKLALTFLFLLIFQTITPASVSVFQGKNKFGLKDESGNVVVDADYKKLVRLGTTAWIMQDGTKFGIINDDGKIVVEPRYNQAERVLGKYVKFAKGDKYGIFDEMGFVILPVEYSSIDLLYGGMFVTCKDYKYGVTDLNGQLILDNIFDDIYMENFNKMVLEYGNQKISIERKQGEAFEVPYDYRMLNEEYDVSISNLTTSPLAATGYYGVTATDYLLKLVSSISPAYEQTIDELMFSQGADTVSVLMKLSWIPKFPFVYAKKYYKYLVSPNNGPLNTVKMNLKSKVKE